MAPRIIEAPDELTRATVAIEKNMRTAVGDSLPEPDPLRPAASPVDTNTVAPQADSLAKLRMVNQVLDSAAGTAQTGIAFFDQLQRRTVEKEKDKVGAAISAKEVIDSTPPAMKWIAKALNPFIGQGAREQFGENMRVRAAAAFESARIAENARRIKAGEPPLIEPTEVISFAQDYFDEAMFGHENGQDPDFQRGFRSGLANEVAAIAKKQEAFKLQRVLNDAYESIDQSAREAADALIYTDPDMPVNQNILRDTIREVTLNSEIGLDDPDVLTKRTIEAVTSHLLDVARNDWRDLTAPELANIKANLMEAAGANSDSRAAVSDGMNRVEQLVAQAQTSQAEVDDDLDDQRETYLKGMIQTYVKSGRLSEAREATLELAEVMLDPGKATTYLDNTIELASSVTGRSATREAIRDMDEFIDRGPTTTEMYARMDAIQQQYNVVFNSSQIESFKNDQDTNERNRISLNSSPAYRSFADEMDRMAKRAGEVTGWMNSELGITTMTDAEKERNAHIRETRRSWEANLMSYARANPESVRANDEAFQAVARRITDDHLRRLESIAQDDPDRPQIDHGARTREFRRNAEKRERALGVFPGSLESEVRDMQSQEAAEKAREDALNARRAQIMMNAVSAIDAAFPPGESRDVNLTSKAYAYMLSDLPGSGLPEDTVREAGKLLATVPDPRNPSRSLRGAFDEALELNRETATASR